MMRVLVCGGRDFTRYWLLYNTLDDIQDDRGRFKCVITGGQKTRDPASGEIIGGADYWAESWAWMQKIPCEEFKADWYPNGLGRLDKSAGPRRNQRMIDEGKPDLVVAFPGGRGTADMVSRARKAGIEVIEVPPFSPSAHALPDEGG